MKQQLAKISMPIKQGLTTTSMCESPTQEQFDDTDNGDGDDDDANDLTEHSPVEDE